MKFHAKRLVSASVAAAVFAWGAHAMANPTAGTVVGGSASISTSGNTLTVTSTTATTIINWQGFSIAAGEVTNFVQPASSSAVLNRVTTQNPSTIFGSLLSNGKVFLVNPNGVLFGAGAQVNAASFTASTINVTDSAFLAGTADFMSGVGSTISFDGLQNFNGPVNVDPTGITVNGDFGDFSASNIYASGPVMQLGGTLTIGNPPLVTPGAIINNFPLTLPTGGTIVSGNATIANSGNLSISTSPGIVINWQSFSIGTGVTSNSAGSVGTGSLTLAGIGSGNPSAASPTIQSATVVPSGVGAGVAGNATGSAGLAGKSISVSVNLQKREPLF